MKPDEHVWAVQRDNLPPSWLGVRLANQVEEHELAAAIASAKPQWLPRSEVERREQWKQLIPYAIIAAPKNRIAVYPRNGSETRLHGRFSAGAGGHVNPCDQAEPEHPLQTLRNALVRELDEEFEVLPVPESITLLGVINEEESAVGRVHFGIVHHVAIANPANTVPGPELAGLQWRTRTDASTLELELWSRLALSLAGKQ